MGQGDVDAIDDLLADDYVDHTPPPGFEPSREAQKQVAAFMRDTSSDKSIDLRVPTAQALPLGQIGAFETFEVWNSQARGNAKSRSTVIATPHFARFGL